MNYKFIIAPILIAFLASCSSWKQTTNSNLSNPSQTNISINTEHVKFTKDDNSTKATVFGKRLHSKKGQNQFFPENKKEFINGDLCKYCEYLARTENKQGNLIEVEVSQGFRNGEEREYHDGELIRSSYYVEGRRCGMEYYYSNGKKIDSAQVETIFGSNLNTDKVFSALPEPAAYYIHEKYLKNKPLESYAFLFIGNKIHKIYNANENDEEKRTYLPIISVYYDKKDDLSNFRVIFTKPFYEEMIFTQNNLVQRQKIKGYLTILDFKSKEYLKELYDNGVTKKLITGDITSLAADSAEQCQGTCHLKYFYENGTLKKELFIADNIVKQEKDWNAKNVLTFECKLPEYIKLYNDDGTVQLEMRGKLSNDFKVVDGTSTIFHRNGAKNLVEKYKKGELVSKSFWNENGKLQSEFAPSKYYKTFYENGKTKELYEGNILLEGNNMSFPNGTIKQWSPDGHLTSKTVFKNNIITALTSWDSKGAPIMDYERNKFIKFYMINSPITCTELIGDIIYDNANIDIRGNVVEKGYNGKTLVYEYFKEGYIPEMKTYQNMIAYTYDSTGNKIKEITYLLDKIIAQKNWTKGNSPKQGYYLSIDFNASSHFKTYLDSKKIMFDYKGTSEFTDGIPKFIDGTETRYHLNGEKSTTNTWKDGLSVSGKKWNDHGVLEIDYDSEKYVKFFSEKTKKCTFDFKGTSEIADSRFILIDGVAQTFDEKGKLLKTETYKDREIVNPSQK